MSDASWNSAASFRECSNKKFLSKSAPAPTSSASLASMWNSCAALPPSAELGTVAKAVPAAKSGWAPSAPQSSQTFGRRCCSKCLRMGLACRLSSCPMVARQRGCGAIVRGSEKVCRAPSCAHSPSCNHSSCRGVRCCRATRSRPLSLETTSSSESGPVVGTCSEELYFRDSDRCCSSSRMRIRQVQSCVCHPCRRLCASTPMPFPQEERKLKSWNTRNGSKK